MATNFVTVNPQPVHVHSAPINPVSVPVITAPVVQTVPPEERGKRYADTYKYLGFSQIALGGLSILFAIVAVAIVSADHNNPDPALGLSYTCSGIWCGVFFVATGILGWLSSRQPDPCKINLAMTFAIVASVVSFIMLSIESAAASYSSLWGRSSVYPVHVILVLIALGEFFVSIIHSAFCCAATCCYSYTPAVTTNTIVTTTTTTHGPGPYQPGVPMNAPPPMQQSYHQQVPQQPPVKMDMSNQPGVTPYYPNQPGGNPYYPNQPGFQPAAPGTSLQPQGYPAPYPPNVDQPPPYKE